MGSPQTPDLAKALGLPEGTEVLNMNSENFTEDFRKATGIGPDEIITIVTPQFERLDGKVITDETINASPIDFTALPNMSHEEILATGCGVWKRSEQGVHYLFPKEWYDIIPGGLEVAVIDGSTEVFVPGETDNDYRFGLLAYGFIKAA